jgi:LacI family transcriptional regulator
MKPKHAGIHDVARAAGVHPSTVSRVLNARTRHLVSLTVAMRVAAAAQRLGYTPDPVAAGLRTRRSHTIGVLIPDLANPVFPPIVRGIESVLTDAGYTAIIANTDNEPARARAALDRFAARRVDGLVLATALRRDPLIARARTLGLPTVLVNRTIEAGAIPAVVNDDAAGIALAVGHLVALGHAAIGHVAGPQQLSTGAARRAGYLAAIKARGIPVRGAPVAAARSYDIAAGAQAARTLLDTHPRLTAIVAANDLLALGCYDELARRGLACPRDVSVVGFNDMPFADRFSPPLTTVHIPLRLIGVEAARLLLEAIERPGAPEREVRLAPRLVVRGSTARPRREPAEANPRPAVPAADRRMRRPATVESRRGRSHAG